MNTEGTVIPAVRADFNAGSPAPASPMRMVAAQVLWIVGLFLGFIMVQQWYAGLYQNLLGWEDQGQIIAMIMGFGTIGLSLLIAAVLQMLVMRHWIINRWLWILVNLAVGAITLPAGLWWVIEWNLFGAYFSAEPVVPGLIKVQVMTLHAVLSAMFGLIVGPLFGFAQSQCLKSGRMRWFWVCTFTVSGLFALIGLATFWGWMHD